MSSFPAVTSFMFVFVQVFFYSTKISRKVFHKASVFCRRFDTMANSNLIVEIEQGKLKGVFQKSILTRNEYCSFLGIPFAKPPVDSLRFQVRLYFKAIQFFPSTNKLPKKIIQPYFSNRHHFQQKNGPMIYLMPVKWPNLLFNSKSSAGKLLVVKIVCTSMYTLPK